MAMNYKATLIGKGDTAGAKAVRYNKQVYRLDGGILLEIKGAPASAATPPALSCPVLVNDSGQQIVIINGAVLEVVA